MDEHDISPEAFQAVMDLAKLSLTFGMVDRATCHPDGVTPESDTDHTVMLGLVACAFAERFAPELDRGLVAQFALVHDLVEAYAGDTATARIMTHADHSEKKEREGKALARIDSEFSKELPWIPNMITAYESLATPEARFVKILDKTVPKIVNIFNQGVAFKRQGNTDREKGEAFLRHQLESIRDTYGSDQALSLRFLERAGVEMINVIF